MSYSNYTLQQVEQQFDLQSSRNNIFTQIKSIPPSEWLQESLQKGKKIAIKSEKSRSEMIVAPILLELLERNPTSFSLFSGENFDVDSSLGLNGECDFLLSKMPKAYIIKAPVFALVEAKQNIVEKSMGQCAAQMLGAQIFNKTKKENIPTIFGCVTNGDTWQFLQLTNKQLIIDEHLYYLADLPKLLGVLQMIIEKTKN